MQPLFLFFDIFYDGSAMQEMIAQYDRRRLRTKGILYNDYSISVTEQIVSCNEQRNDDAYTQEYILHDK